IVRLRGLRPLRFERFHFEPLAPLAARRPVGRLAKSAELLTKAHLMTSRELIRGSRASIAASANRGNVVHFRA
ncbi:MAG: hypothetical protein MUE69_15305, partial [Myxococcota bacterium]|nr:hypothetical protein [Myxococcota bacterium]